ncbi:hypothetical protein QBC47DRAFT_387916 [Echria macrotheca]|uniref:SET domain-containing protein n=1 Tax=Echria macrotheca TaxID=438768 RepID=A0AAJ0B9Z9_9PEZI|nr:hypothetical protein QBC47DRAFT_387916 [Echria macrotheca]
MKRRTMALDHPYRQLPIPTNAPFELKPSPGRGWGAFATRRIERGALILSEEPLFTIRKPHAEITNEVLLRALQKLPASRKRMFFLLRDNASGAFQSLKHAFAENSFNMASEDHTTGRQLDCLHGLFLLHSRFNHSCSPNSKVPVTVTGGEITHLQSFATRDIAPGEEIAFSYAADFGCRTREERHRELRFVCNCDACQPGTPFQELSDMRRRLVRGLQYLQTGVDLDGRRQDAPDRPLIADPQLKRAAETFRIPLSSRFIYGLLVMSLLEQEGLLDDFLAERLSRNVWVPFAAFETESNVQVAKLAMAQQDWLGRLCVAFQLYGRADAADQALATLFQSLSGR